MQKSNKRKIILILILLALILLFYFTFNSNRTQKKELFESAEANISSENYDAAKDNYQEIISIDENDTQARYGLISLALETDDLDLAKTNLDYLSKNYEDSEKYQHYLYKYAMKVEDYALAESIVIKYPDFVESVDTYKLIISKLTEGSYYTQAAELADQALKIYPEDNDLKALAIDVYLKTKAEDKALNLFEAGVENISQENLNLIISIYKDRNELDNLINALEVSLESDFEQEEVQAQLYALYASTNDLKSLWNLRAKILETGEDLPDLSENVMGNSFANVRYRAPVSQQGNTVYFTSSFARTIYKAPESNIEDSTRVLARRAKSLNVKGDWLYFLDVDKQDALARVKTDGSAYEVIYDKTVKDPIVFGDNIYFINAADQKIYKMDLDGSNLSKFNTKNVFQFVLDPLYIYYIDDEGRDLYRQELSPDSEAELIDKGRYQDLNIDEFSNLYYLDQDEGGYIIKNDYQGEARQILSKETATYLNYYNFRLYYSNWTPHSMDIKGENKLNLANNISKEMGVIKNWVFSLELDPSVLTDYIDINYFKHDGSEWSQLSTKW